MHRLSETLCVKWDAGDAILYTPIGDDPEHRDPYNSWIVLSPSEQCELIEFLMSDLAEEG